MPKKNGAKKKSKHVALLLLEGETEEEFYAALADIYFKGVPKKVKNLKGNFSIHRKVLDAARQYSDENPHNTFDVYVCIDQERLGPPALNKDFLREELEVISGYRKLHAVIAVLMIESLFFIDMDGIYRYLRAKSSKRNCKKYSSFRNFTHVDLSALFKQFRKIYYKGHRCKGLVASLDIRKIKETADELTEMINKLNNKK